MSELEKSLADKNEEIAQKINQFTRNISMLEGQKGALEEKIIELNKEKGESKK